MEKSYPAPWSLSGKGYILLYKFSKEFVKENCNVPVFLDNSFTGGFGTIMIVDYASSDVGPYGELLFIPGKFNHKNRKLNTITNIYVSSKESVVNGRKNWGIPKEQANFKFSLIDKNTEKVNVNKDTRNIAELTLKSGGISFPVSTKLLPFPLVQSFEGRYYYTSFHGTGVGKLAKLTEVKINSELFPDVSSLKPLLAIKVEPFSITFPKAKIQSIK